MNASILHTSVPDEATARQLANTLLDRRLVACVWIMPPHTALYRWEGVREEAKEHLLVIKTIASHVEATKLAIVEWHPYQCPEIMEFSPTAVHPPYLAWMKDCCEETDS